LFEDENGIFDETLAVDPDTEFWKNGDFWSNEIWGDSGSADFLLEGTEADGQYLNEIFSPLKEKLNLLSDTKPGEDKPNHPKHPDHRHGRRPSPPGDEKPDHPPHGRHHPPHHPPPHHPQENFTVYHPPNGKFTISPEEYSNLKFAVSGSSRTAAFFTKREADETEDNEIIGQVFFVVKEGTEVDDFTLTYDEFEENGLTVNATVPKVRGPPIALVVIKVSVPYHTVRKHEGKHLKSLSFVAPAAYVNSTVSFIKELSITTGVGFVAIKHLKTGSLKTFVGHGKVINFGSYAHHALIGVGSGKAIIVDLKTHNGTIGLLSGELIEKIQLIGKSGVLKSGVIHGSVLSAVHESFSGSFDVKVAAGKAKVLVAPEIDDVEFDEREPHWPTSHISGHKGDGEQSVIFGAKFGKILTWRSSSGLSSDESMEQILLNIPRLQTSPKQPVLQTFEPFCTAPFVRYAGALPFVAPCLIDTFSSAAFLAVAVALAGLGLYAFLRQSSTPALRAGWTFARGLLLSVSLVLAAAAVAELTVDVGEMFTFGSEAPLFTGPARMTSDLFGLFSWLVITLLLLLVDGGNVFYGVGREAPWVFAAALALDLPGVYQWVLILNYANDKDLPKLSFADTFHFSTFVLKFVIVFLVVVFSLVFKGFQRTRSTVDLETSNSNAGPERSSWLTTIERLQKLFPFIWPDTWSLRFLVFTCIGLLLIGRVVNWAVPHQYQVVVDSLIPSNSNGKIKVLMQDKLTLAWGAILLFVFLRFLQGGVGLVSTISNLFWIPVAQFTTRKISVQMMRHLHGLSLQFHLTRKTGEVLRVMDRGVSSIGSLLSYILFNIIPVIADIAVAVVIFFISFDIWLSMIVFTTMILYIVATIAITEWRTKFRKDMINLDNKARTRSVDSLLNFETVKYYNAEEWEVQQYDLAIQEYMKADWVSSASMNLLNTVQNGIISIGMLAGSIMCAKRVVDEELSVGQLGSYYRAIQQNFIDMEQMLDLFKVSKGVEDKPDAMPLTIQGGTVEFENVCFSYDSRKTTLENISFKVPAGKTVALVGESGSGKSTIFRLLFRFYDVTKGNIKVDGQDIRDVVQDSLRRHIGVVPQDTVLFNNDIRYNIRYGDVSADDNMVEEAAKAAQIHSRILEFPDKYETKVGERGLRLS
ncbi:Homocysteine S-methyltransferase 1, partial [Nowakowskiella sp. JEL0078]